MVEHNSSGLHLWKGPKLSLRLSYCYLNITNNSLTKVCLHFALDPVNYLADVGRDDERQVDALALREN